MPLNVSLPKPNLSGRVPRYSLTGNLGGGVRFVPNPVGLAKIPIQPGLVAELLVLAKKGAEEAKRIAPVLTGAYRDSLQGVAGIENGHAVGRIYSDDFKAWFIEAGTGEPGPTEAFAVLRRAQDSLHV